MANSRWRDGESEPSPLLQQKGADHVVSNRHRLSLKKYPRDCPPLRPQWFHAVDVPKRRPHPAGELRTEKPLTAPKKYAAFSKTDSKAIEAAFQKLVEEEDEDARVQLQQQRGDNGRLEGSKKPRSDNKPNLSLQSENIKVPVNEDYLFDVDVERRELAPAYWLGPVYDVRRGTWFYQDGSVQRPCDENLAAQLEEGYLKIKAWRLPSAQAAKTKPRSASQPRSRPASWAPGQNGAMPTSQPVSAKPSQPDLRKQADEDMDESSDTEPLQSTHRLFGAHMNSVVTYQDATTAWLLTDDFMSRMNYSMYQRFAGGGHFAGMKMTRGYTNPDKKADAKDVKNPEGSNSGVKANNNEEQDPDAQTPRQASSEMMRQSLTRQMSSLLDSPSGEDAAKQDEEMRRRAEREIEDDYRETEGDDQGREIEHLILVTHGIGQRLGLRLESVNFVHDVNTLRKTLKAVYADSPDLRALNAELGESDSLNSRVQVLPINWRQKLQFPKQSLRHNRREHDLADTDFDEDEYPTLDDISVDGVPAVRNLLTDLALDILLYESPIYKQHISGIVVEECNRIYDLWMRRNPGFAGKISLVGHSLGSAIFFDILSRQDQSQVHASRRKANKQVRLNFEVEDFYALGSPIGLFEMLGGRTIAARTDAASRVNTATSMDDPMLAPVSSKKSNDSSNAPIAGEMPVSRPKCAQIFNIFHPTDPISYRIEPLISPAMASLKPQPLPYTKRGIFGAPVGQGLTGIGARVSQSVSSMWSSMASSLLTRGLGYGDEPRQASGNNQASAKSSGPLFMPNIPNNSGQGSSGSSNGFFPTAAPLPPEGTEIIKITNESAAKAAEQHGLHPPTLIDAELETLYGGYEKRRKSVQSDAVLRDLGAGAVGSPEWAEAEERGKRLRREEEKVRRLNSNGRVDYCIQESAWDINLISAIASHLSYWSDEDTSHFLLSQLLSRHRIVRPRAPSQGRSK